MTRSSYRLFPAGARRTTGAIPLVILGVLALPFGAAAQIVINELLPNPSGDDVGTERIEIVNAGPIAIDVTGWAIDDAATIDQALTRCRLPEDFIAAGCPTGAVIQPGEFRVLKGQTTAAFLNNAGDDVYIVTNRTATPPVVDVVSYPDAGAQVDQVWSAIPNGSENFAWRTQTLCASNGGASDFIPPSAVSDLAAGAGTFPGEVRLTWTAPGDDGASGTASAYEIRVASATITSGTFAAATSVSFWINEPLPRPAGSAETLFVFGMDPDSVYHFALRAIDDAANAGAVSNSPSTAPTAGAPLDPDLGYAVYFGNLHSHTGYSDGVQTPADAYAFARDTAPTPLDFLAVTDHNHSGAGMSLPNYALGLAAAESANSNGEFVAIYGQEWGLTSGGHVNIFQAPVLFGWEGGNHDVFVAEGDYSSLYSAIVANPPPSDPPVAEWCHPALSDFDNFQLTPEGRAVVRLIALVNGPFNSTAVDESDVGNTGFDASFQEALQKGYRVSPTGDQDNHNANWGASTQSRTGVLANEKTRSAIMNALASGRNYASQDHNAVVAFSAEGHAMGQAFTSPGGIRLSVRVTDPDGGEGVSLVELFRGQNGGAMATRVAWSAGNSEFAWRERGEFAPGTEMHYYLKIRQNDNALIWTGPVFVTYTGPTDVALLEGGAPAVSIRLDAPRPNPSRGPVTFEFSLAGGSSGRARVSIYDASGRLLRVLSDGPLPAGRHVAAWDGRTDDGRSAPPGVYLLRLEADEGAASRKLLLVR